jgi:hypothetical protein
MHNLREGKEWLIEEAFPLPRFLICPQAAKEGSYRRLSAQDRWRPIDPTLTDLFDRLQDALFKTLEHFGEFPSLDRELHSALAHEPVVTETIFAFAMDEIEHRAIADEIAGAAEQFARYGDREEEVLLGGGEVAFIVRVVLDITGQNRLASSHQRQLFAGKTGLRISQDDSPVGEFFLWKPVAVLPNDFARFLKHSGPSLANRHDPMPSTADSLLMGSASHLKSFTSSR